MQKQIGCCAPSTYRHVISHEILATAFSSDNIQRRCQSRQSPVGQLEVVNSRWWVVHGCNASVELMVRASTPPAMIGPHQLLHDQHADQHIDLILTHL